MYYYNPTIKRNILLDTCCNMAEAWKHYESEKPDTEGHRFNSTECPEQGNPQRRKAVWRLLGARGMGERGATA